MAITQESLQLEAQLTADADRITDAQIRTLVAAWVLAWSEVSADLQDTLTELYAAGGKIRRTTLVRSVRLRQVLGVIADKLTDLADDAGVTISADLPDLIDRTARAQRGILAAQLPRTLDAAALLDKPWEQSDSDALAAIVKRSTQQITSSVELLAPETYDVIRRELIRGVSVGTSPRETARRMVARTEGNFFGGLTRAMNIARTETLDAHREAGRMGQDRHPEVLQGWTWLCHLSARTCPSCLARHGTVHPLSEPGPEDHPQGRCARQPRTKSWADLGFDIDEPADDIVDAREWFDALTEAEQLQIMGRARLKLLRDGDITFEDLTSKRSNTRWRDSWQITPVRVLAQRSRGRRARAS